VDPANILTLITLMIATAFAAQISAFTLFGDPESSSNRGIIGLVLDFIAPAQNAIENMGDDDMDGEDGDMDGEDDVMDGEDGDMEGEDGGMEGEDGEMEDETEEEEEEMTEEGEVLVSIKPNPTAGNGDMEEVDDLEDEDGSRGGLIEAVIAFITGLFSVNNDDNDMPEDGDNMEGSDEMSESEEEGSGMDGGLDDTMENSGSDGGSSFGGISASLHPIDLAALFVQVQEAIGMNCTCAEGALTEEIVTDATIRLMEEEKMKKMRKFKKVLNKTEKKKNKKNLKNKKEKQDTRKRVGKTA
jgi:hypothetical protein